MFLSYHQLNRYKNLAVRFCIGVRGRYLPNNVPGSRKIYDASTGRYKAEKTLLMLHQCEFAHEFDIQ